MGLMFGISISSFQTQYTPFRCKIQQQVYSKHICGNMSAHILELEQIPLADCQQIVDISVVSEILNYTPTIAHSQIVKEMKSYFS